MNKITLIDLVNQWITSDGELSIHFAVSGHCIIDYCPAARHPQLMPSRPTSRVYAEILETEVHFFSPKIKLPASAPNFFTMSRAILRKLHNDTKWCNATIHNNVMVDPYDTKT